MVFKFTRFTCIYTSFYILFLGELEMLWVGGDSWSERVCRVGTMRASPNPKSTEFSLIFFKFSSYNFGSMSYVHLLITQFPLPINHNHRIGQTSKPVKIYESFSISFQNDSTISAELTWTQLHQITHAALRPWLLYASICAVSTKAYSLYWSNLGVEAIKAISLSLI